MKRLLLTLLLVVSLCTCARAQKSQDLRIDSTFFKQKAELYQRWLDHSGIGQYLQYRELEVWEDGLNIYLEFKGNDFAFNVNSWEATKAKFETTAPITLEEQLFYEALALMEVPPGELIVLLYGSYGWKNESFERIMYFQDGKVQVREDNPKSNIKPIRITPRSITGGKPLSVEDLKIRYTERKVYECILDYARTTFVNKGLDGVLPEIKVIQEEDNLLFKVINLRREVLPDNIAIRLCEAVGLRDDCARREVLTFLFTYDTTEDGIRIRGDIDGKYGSGIYANVPRGSYLSMTIDFDDQLQEYIETMTYNIKKHLRSCQ